MIRLSRLADYAIVLMTYFADERRPLYSAHELANKTGLTEATVSKLLKSLARAGLLESTRGAKGGYQMVKALSEISVADVITAVDGPIALTDCVEDAPGECNIESCCPMKLSWQRINDVIRTSLHQLTLAEVMEPAFNAFMEPITIDNDRDTKHRVTD